VASLPVPAAPEGDVVEKTNAALQKGEMERARRNETISKFRENLAKSTDPDTAYRQLAAAIRRTMRDGRDE
jgi:hypothetical protein